MKKKYVTPFSERIQIEGDEIMNVRTSRANLSTDKDNWMQDETSQTEDQSGNGNTPATRGDYSVTPGGDLGDGFGKVNPWDSWD